MAKISPVSIKYMVHASFIAEGALEKPDVIGAIFGQTEGLLGADLEMRELQKEGKIGRIEVDLERNDKKTTGMIKIPTALVDQMEVGGRMVVPVGDKYQKLLLITKTEEGFEQETLLPVRFVPMVH